MSEVIIVLNAGSSSIKFALFEAHMRPTPQHLICDGAFDGIGHRVHFTATDRAGAVLADDHLPKATSHEDAIAGLIGWIERTFPDRALAAAGHRVVHGGLVFTAPVRVDAVVLHALRELVPLAPLHQPHNLAAIEALAKLHPSLPQVACFDTGFHHTQPEVAAAFALPRRITAQGVRRYGFHGLSYEYIASVLPATLGAVAAEGKIVVAHLGGGSSLCAMHERASVATTMGFTALDGLPMGSRCGNLDPGAVLYLIQQQGMTAAAVNDMLYHASGMLGVSGVSDDMRTLLASADPHAKEAIDLFVYRIGRELGSLAAALGGLDALVFTGGIGEHATEIRRLVCAQAGWLGVTLDAAANAAGAARITIADSKTSVWVIPTNEDLMIARHVWRLIERGAQTKG
ncbi:MULTISPECIES: acetate/propionate family kinase [Rhodopseudomonas]|uniref:Acetate kinase n=1 Tax=Rhodopseudomonas palustris TaxID=1076 RepID=A0A0D7EF72_RHOPL|nr:MULTISPECIES: acetate/propionate family kinase [Rhodopseudomonas]KIZ39388.1 acetate kinase [Rhodopseudomonas palustris]MDF3809576.1 acetate/propionate family kinase [Rhodopseudomonas sp. BAL398]WOK17773.1 acetate/propionate family kinase [Rhodopseudomonas sp. BAL398]